MGNTFSKLSDWASLSHDQQRSIWIETRGGIPILLITDDDFLCGRGFVKNNHPGNMRLNKLTASILPKYKVVKTNTEKRRVQLMIYDEITKAGGLFLENCPCCKEIWIPLNQAQALKKIQQNLVDKRKKRKKTKIRNVVASPSDPSETKKAANDDTGTKSTEGTRGSPSSAETASSDTNETLSASMPPASDQSPNDSEAGPGQLGIKRTLPQPAFSEVVEVTKNEYEKDESITIEKASLTGVDWSLSSATLSNPEDAWPRLVRFMVEVFRVVAEPPSEKFARCCYRMRAIDKAYVKTIRIPRDHGLDGTIVGAVVDVFYENGFGPYFQLYSALWLLLWLTSIHQDGGKMHGDVYRIFIRIFGFTGFFSSSNEQNLFYTSDSHKTIRATLATHKAFSGVTKDGGNNGVFHAGGQDGMALPSMAIMAEKEDYSMLNETDHIKALQLMMSVVDQLSPSSNLQQDLELLRFYDNKIFGDGGTICGMKQYAPGFRSGYLTESLETQWKVSIPFPFSFDPEILKAHGINIPIFAPESNYNPNTDVVIMSGFDPSFREKVNRTRGNTIYRRLVKETAKEYMKIGKFEKDANGRKTDLRVKLVNDFHEHTDGGRFFTIHGDGTMVQLSAEKLIRGKGSVTYHAVACQIEKLKEEEKKPTAKKRAGGLMSEQPNKLCCTKTSDDSNDDNVANATAAAAAARFEDILPPEPVDIDYGKQFEKEMGMADEFVLCEPAPFVEPPPQKKRHNTHPRKWRRKALAGRGK